MVKFDRASGILLHITSLPGPNGIGDIGHEAFKFVDFLYECRQKIWQILPLTACERASPYSGTSAFAGNPLLISLEKLVDEGVLDVTDIESTRPSFTDRLEHAKVLKWKYSVLSRAYDNYKKNPSKQFQKEIKEFVQKENHWLNDYALFMAIREEQNSQSWSQWPKELRQREDSALEKKQQQHADIIERHVFLQYIFFRQWNELKTYANEHDVIILGDMPVYVDYDSADVWANQSLFQLDPVTSFPLVVAGCPPDSEEDYGQLWGNPIYDWAGSQRKTKFDWWIKRLKKSLEVIDILRIDHFRGLVTYWAIPVDSDGEPQLPAKGKWVNACGDEFLATITNVLGNDLPLVVEDLGYLTQEIIDLRDKYDLSGMRVLEYGFGSDANNMYLPHNYVRNCIAYIGTHDNNTSVGWYYHNASKKEKIYLAQYLQKEGDPERDVHWDLIRLILASIANIAIVQFQDVLGLGKGSQMNDPFNTLTPEFQNNWTWRFKWEELKQQEKDKLKLLTNIYGRHIEKEPESPPKEIE